MSPRFRPLRVLGLLLIAALAFTAFSGTAVAPAKRSHLSAKQKAKIRASLRRAVKKNPNVVSKRWFLKKASIVSFTLPTTIRLLPASNQSGGHVNNDDARLQNSANLDLGPSLGTRSIGLGGSIHANINFQDAFDGGNLGDVRLSIPSDSSRLSSTGVPLLANTNTSDVGHAAPEAELQRFVLSTLGAGATINVTAGTNTTSFTYAPASLEADLKTAVAGLNESCVGSPPCPNNVYVAVVTGPDANFGVPANVQAATITWTGAKAGVNQPQVTLSGGAFIVNPGTTSVNGNDPAPDAEGNTGCGGFLGNGSANDTDLLTNLSNSRDPGTNDNLGPGPDYGGSSSRQDTVLRTNALSIGIAQPGLTVDLPGDNGGGTGINTIKLGANGGKANLFGNPVNGQSAGNSVDVTVNLQTKINSIAREVDGQWPAPAGGGTANEPNGNISANFFCRQAWTGAVQNYLTGINLVGSLKISPAITADGKVRIAKVNLRSKSASKQALAACLSPYQLYMSGNPDISAGSPVTDPYTVGPQLLFGAFNPLYVLAGSNFGQSTAPSADCNSSGGPLNRAPFGVSPIPGGTGSGLQKLLTSGAAVGVSGDLDVTRVRAEVLIGNL
jgi:hypothetical protein